MKKFVLFLLFTFLSLPCFAEETIYLDETWDKEASKILYEHCLAESDLTPEKAYEFFGYKLSDARAVFYDLNSDGINEIIGYINVPYFWCREGMALFVLQKNDNNYDNILNCINFYPENGVKILDTKTAGYYDFERFLTKINFTAGSNKPLTYTYGSSGIAKYNQESKYYENIFSIIK